MFITSPLKIWCRPYWYPSFFLFLWFEIYQCRLTYYKLPWTPSVYSEESRPIGGNVQVFTITFSHWRIQFNKVKTWLYSLRFVALIANLIWGHNSYQFISSHFLSKVVVTISLTVRIRDTNIILGIQQISTKPFELNSF